MSLRIVCSGFLVRQPLGGNCWCHLQYLVGLQRLGHEVTYFEHYGWPSSCFDPQANEMTSKADYGTRFLGNLLAPHGLQDSWCYLAEDGQAHGLPRSRLAAICRQADLYLNLSNINWIPELEECRRRVMVDTDPVFTQMKAHGAGGPFDAYQVRFTYGENVHKPDSEMPTAGVTWRPTRQPVVLELWQVAQPNPSAPFTTVMNWSPLGDKEYAGRIYGGKDRAFEAVISLPKQTGERIELAVKAPPHVETRLLKAGWALTDPVQVTQDPDTYQRYLKDSRAEFSVAKHGYVVTRCGWFSERSTSYMASGRPVLIQETGFSDWLETGAGVVPFRTLDEAVDGIREINSRYEFHCRAARALVEQHFDSGKVLNRLLEFSLQ